MEIEILRVEEIGKLNKFFYITHKIKIIARALI